MEIYEKNIKRNLSIIISILLHLLLFSFLFYKLEKEIKKIRNFEENKDILSYIPIHNIPQKILNEQEQQPNIENNVKNDSKPKEEIKKEIELKQDKFITKQNLKIKNNESKKIKHEIKKVKNIQYKKIRRSILSQIQPNQTFPNIAQYVKQEIQNELIQTLGEKPNSDFRHIGYQEKIMKMISDAFIALYSGKQLGVPKHEYDLMVRGVLIEIRISINQNGALNLVDVISPATEFNNCLKEAIKYAAPFPRIPKHFNTDIYNIKTRINTALNMYGSGIMHVYPK